MKKRPSKRRIHETAALRAKIAELRAQLREAHETLEAIRNGDVDAVVVAAPEGERVYTLKSAEHPYRILVEQMQQGAAVCLRDGTILYCNRGLAAMSRMPLEKMIGANVQALVPPAERAALAAMLDRVMTGLCEFVRAEFTLQATAGTGTPAHLAANLVQGDGAPYICLVATDLTERVQAEQALRRSHDELEQRVRERTAELGRANEALVVANEELEVTTEELREQNDELEDARTTLERERQRYADLFSLAPDGYVVTDAKGMILEANHAAIEMLGVRDVFLPGKPIFMFVARGSRPSLRGCLQELRPGAGPRTWETALESHDGRKIPAAVSVNAVFDASGKATTVRWLLRDITERKAAEEALRQSEARFRALAEALPEIVWTADAAGGIEWFNQRWYEYTGQPHGRGEGWSWDQVAHPDDLPRALTKWRRACEEGGIFENEIRVRRHDGQFRWFLVRAWPLRDADGNVVRWFGTNTDVEDMKRAEEGLRASEAQLQRAQQIANLGSWEWDIESGALLWSEQIYRQMGEEPGAVTLDLDSFMKYIHPEDRVKFEAAIEETLAGAAPYDQELRIVHRGGAVRVLHVQGEVLAGPDGRPRGMMGISLDVTERKRAEEELHRLNRAMRALGRSNQALAHAQGEAEYLDEVCKIIVEDCGQVMVWVGYAEDDDEKSVRPAAYAGLEEGYLETLKITWADTERGRGPTGTAIRTGKPCGCADMRTDPQFAPWREEAVKRGYASSMVLPLLAAGKAFGAMTIYAPKPHAFGEAEVRLLMELADDVANGITMIRIRAARAQAEAAVRRSEQRERHRAAELQTIFDTAPIGLAIAHDPQGRHIRGNPALERTVGVSRGGEFSKAPSPDRPAAGFRVLSDGREVPVEKLPVQRAVQGEVVTGQVLEVVRADGRTIRLYSNAAPLFDEQGRPRGAVAAFLDITSLVQAQQALQETAAELARSNNELEQFAYVASHDLQEPLRMVTGYMHLLKQRYTSKLDATAEEFIDYAVDGAVRMSQLITDLLAYARVGTHGVEFTTVDCYQVVDRALAALLLAIEDSQAVITHDPLPSVHGDANQLARLFQNLLANAIKFRGEAPPRIHIGAERAEGMWEFSIRDNGIGIEEQHSERIFMMFQRLHSREQYPGTGIGLAICKKIVERHRGRIWVESKPGEGSTFHFTLPAAKEEAGERVNVE